jgi:hypothetical protein
MQADATLQGHNAGGLGSMSMTKPLDLNAIITSLRTTPFVLRALGKGLSGQASAWHPGVGKWCVKEVVGHLIEEDKRDFVGRIRLMLDQEEPRLAVTDQEAIGRMRHDCDKRLDDLLEEFNPVRAESIAFASELKDTELHRGGIHPRIGHIRISNLLHEWIYHDLNHLRQIGTNVQSFLWPHLGNMQGFYRP